MQDTLNFWQEKVEEKVKELAKINREIKANNLILGAFDSEVEKRKHTISNLDRNIKTLQSKQETESQKLENKRLEVKNEQSTCEELKSQISILECEKQPLEQKRLEKTQKISELEKEILNLSNNKKRLTDSVEENKKTVKNQEENIEQLTSETMSAESKKADKLKELAEIDEQIRQKFAAKEKELNDKEADLLEREGDLSIKTEWMRDIKKLLENGKKEIEQFHGKLLKHIPKFPDF